MRQIKFRLLHEGEVIYVDGDQVELITTKNGFDLLLHEQYFETGSGVAEEMWRVVRHPCENLMQYTGLKDKNGKEIYEGDCFRFLNDTDRWIIRWNDDDAGFEGYEPTSGSLTNCFVGDEMELLGSIYENPELIQE